MGIWKVSGDAEGTVRFEWMKGSFFLVQHIDLENYAQSVKGLEVIGHLWPFGEAASEDIKSRFYDSMSNTFDYVYEADSDTFMIWGGEKGSPA